MANLLQIKNISKSYAGEEVLRSVNFTVGERKRIGVIGRNGAGKSTLFKMIMGTEEPTDGEIMIYDGTRIGYIEQEDDFLEGEIVMDYLLRKTGKEDWRCRKIAAGFGLKGSRVESPVRSLSGGFQMRVKLVAMILCEPNLLLLDEPTNYLDLATMFLLEKFLLSYKGSYLVISHDQGFITNIAKEIIEIDRGKAFYFRGSLEAYFTFRVEKIETSFKFNQKQDRKLKHLQSFVNRFRYKSSKAKQAQSKLKQIEKIKKTKVQGKQKRVLLRVGEITKRTGLALRLENLAIGYPDYVVASGIEMDIEKGEHIAILGDNGQGKTTFMRTIAGDLEKVGGKARWMPNINIAYYSQHLIDAINYKEKVVTYLERVSNSRTREDCLRVAASLLFSESDLEKTISVLSGGEKARLSLAGLLLSGADVLLLDEPTNHLDFDTVEVLTEALAESPATVLFISHNRTFINTLADKIIEVKDGEISRFGESYDDYVYYIKSKVGISVGEAPQKKILSVEKKKKRELYEENKMIRNTIQKIEKKLDKLNIRKAEILKEFEENPTIINPDLNLELKGLDTSIIENEHDWLEENAKIL